MTPEQAQGDNRLDSSGDACHAWPHGVRSLFDVVRFAGAELWAATAKLDDSNETEKCAGVIRGELLKMREMCAHLQIDCTDNINRLHNRLSQQPHNGAVVMALVQEAEHIIQKDLRSRLCFLLTRDESMRFWGSALSDAAQSSFPNSSEQLCESARCLALDRYQASVYHAMNALEAPLGAMARYFAIPFEQTTWGTAINNIRTRMEKISQNTKKGPLKTRILQFYGEAAKEFAYFNEAWRVHAMHGRGSYDHHNASSIHNHVRTFTEHLAKRLSSRSRAKCKL